MNGSYRSVALSREQVSVKYRCSLETHGSGGSPGFWWMFLPDEVSVRQYPEIEPPGRFFSSPERKVLTEENFHAKVR